MRFLLLALTASASVALASIACSSTPAPAAETDAGSTALPKTDPPEDPPASTSSSSGNPAPVDAGTGDGSLTDSGGGGTTEGDAGAGCLPTSIRESETNNDVASADVMLPQTGTYCGRITPGADADFMTFTMPNVVNTFNFAIEVGNVKVEPTADGEAFNFNSNNYPFKPGKPYVLKITSNNGNPVDYRIKITIN